MEVFSRLGTECYRSGFVFGFAVAAVLGFIVYLVNDWYKKILRAAKPQVIMHFTSRTPGQVFGSSLAASLGVAGFLVVLLALAFLRADLALPADCALVGASGAVLCAVGVVLWGLSTK